MDITKSTVWGMLLLLLMAGALLFVRGHYLSQQSACATRLVAMAPGLTAYAREHRGMLPQTPAELAKAVGPIDITGYAISPHRLHWQHGKALPYLQDSQKHRFVNGMHILYTDGSVRLTE